MIADMVNQVSSKWWTFLLRGILALALAAFAFTAPGPTSLALVYVFASYFIISGIASMVAGFSFTGTGSWWALVIMGIVSALLGFIMLAQPAAGALSLAWVFALWMVMTGVTEISAAIALRGYVTGEFWWVLQGIITLAFGVYLAMRPDLGLLSLVYTVGFYATFAGIALIGFAFRLRGVGERFGTHHPIAG